ncbi:MAG: PD40 domain-containing protein [Bacteroidetes bacterium]|nr:PD40 domain-containing protein [Bacteroidota bacterium]
MRSFTKYLLLAISFATVPPLVPDAAAQYFTFGKNRVQYNVIEWDFVETQNFDVYFDHSLAELGHYAAESAERSYAEVVQLLRYRATKRIPLIIYGNHDDFGVTNAVELPDYSEGIGGVTELYKNRIAVPFTGDYREFDHVVRHEIVHALINDLFYAGTVQSLIQKNIRFPIPAWFSEGLAEYTAVGWTVESDRFISEAVLSDNLPDVDRLEGAFAYRGGQSFWDYIATQYGRQKIAEILFLFRASHSLDAAFQNATGLTVAELSARWKQSLREIYFPEVAARENLDYIAREIVGDRNAYHTSPSLSPRGDRIAYLSTRSGLFDLYVQRIAGGPRVRLIRGQVSTSFESLPILSPGISWSPDGRYVAVAVKTGRNDAITVVEVSTAQSKAYRVTGVDQILSIDWNPRGDQIAMAATSGARSDLYILSLASGESRNLTNDWFSDHEPAFSPDGRSLVFHSDRGAATNSADARSKPEAQAGPVAGMPFDLYTIEIDSGKLTRLTNTPAVSEHTARYAGSSSSIVFVSDENGIDNLYLYSRLDGRVRPITNLLVGISQMAMSADGSRVALVSFKRTQPAIYVLNNPAERRIDEDRLVPNVLDERRRPGGGPQAPASVLASASVVRQNPFLRDAAEHVSRPDRDASLAEGRSEHVISPDDDMEVSVSLPPQIQSRIVRRTPDPTVAPDPSRPMPYKLRFSPDLVYGTAGYDVLYGVQGVTQAVFSDLLGDHRFTVSTNLLIDLRNLDYVAAYHYLPRRTDWTGAFFQRSRLLRRTLDSLLTYDRFRQVGLTVGASYPLDKFRRFESQLTFVRASQADITVAPQPPVSRAVAYGVLSYIRDITTPGRLGPIRGKRFGASIAGSPVGIGSRGLSFGTVLIDSRFYETFRKDYTLAFRFSSGTSFGRDGQKFYSGGVQNWINREFDALNGFPIDQLSDFVFASPVLPMRGADLNRFNGGTFGLVNLELRFPLITARAFAPTALLPLYRLHGVVFVDAGSVYSSEGGDGQFDIVKRNEQGERELDDVFAGTGVGLRTMLLGYPLRFDVAWPYDGRRLGRRHYYFSIGFDF